MLSTKVITSAAHAAHYFTGKDNYYTQDDKALAESRSNWFGKGAEALNLKGQINTDTFEQLLEGKLPTGDQLGVMKDGERKHRAGYDLTFSVPKSVSVLALLTDDAKLRADIFKAITASVKETLGQIESNCTEARETVDGQTNFVPTGNLIAGLFLHDISRAGDPQLHVHSVVMNATKKPNGDWRALASDMTRYGVGDSNVHGFLNQVRADRPFYNMRFWSGLAARLNELGFEVERTHARGSFEVKGFSPETLRAYSSRSLQIESYMKQNNLSGAAAAELATLNTRDRKTHISRKSLDQLWASRADAAKVDVKGEIERMLDHRHQRQPTPSSHTSDAPTINTEPKAVGDAAKAVSLALATLSEGGQAISLVRLSNLASSYAIGENVRLPDILREIDQLKASGELLALKPDAKQPTHFISRTQLAAEKKLLSFVTIKGTKPLQTTQPLPAMADAILRDAHRVQLLDGVKADDRAMVLTDLLKGAGAGKLSPILLTSTRSGHAFLEEHLPVVSKSVGQFLKHAIGQPKHSTVAKFLGTHESGLPATLLAANNVVIVDQAHRLDRTSLTKLMQLTSNKGARLVLVGDREGERFATSADPYRQLIDGGARTVSMSDHYTGQARHQIQSQEQLARFFDKAAERVIEVREPHELANRLIDHYTSLTDQERSQTLLMAPTRREQEQLNGEISRTLATSDAGKAKAGVGVSVLLPTRVPDHLADQMKHYQVGQYLRVNQDHLRLRLSRGQYYRLSHINAVQHTLTLENGKGRKQTLNGEQFTRLVNGKFGMEVFEQKARTFYQGERLRVMRTDRANSLYKGEYLTFESRKGHALLAKNAAGKTIKLDTREGAGKHLDLGYVSTPYQDDGLKRVKHMIAWQGAHARSTHFARLANLADRAERVTLYTDDAQGLLVQAAERSGVPPTALETYLSAQSQGLPSDAVAYRAMVETLLVNTMQSNNHAINQTDKGQILQTLSPEQAKTLAKEWVDFAIESLSEREAAFSYQTVAKIAMTQAFGEVTPSVIDSVVNEAAEKGEIIQGVGQYQKFFTTGIALEREKAIVEMATDSQSHAPLLSTTAYEAQEKGNQPFASHAPILKDWLTSTQRVHLLQGHAGVGKSTLLVNAHHALNTNDVEMRLVAPTHEAVESLRADGLSAQTLESFLVRYRPTDKQAQTDEKRSVWVLDESTLASTRQVHQLLKFANAEKAHVMLVGDLRQEDGVEAGADHGQLFGVREKSYELTDIKRQKPDWYQAVVAALYSKQFDQAIAQLEHRLVEVDTKDYELRQYAKEKGLSVDEARHHFQPTEDVRERADLRNRALAEATAKAYVTLTPALRAQKLMSVTNNRMRLRVNEAVREQLMEKGELGNQPMTVNALESRHLTRAEARRATFYESGDVVRFSLSQPESGIAKGDYCEVVSASREHNLVTLKRENGEEVHWLPTNKGAQLYERHSLELRTGDLVSWTQTDERKGRFSANLMRVIDHNGGKQLTVAPIKIDRNGHEKQSDAVDVMLDNPDNQHLRHAYAVTTYRAQGRTVDTSSLTVEADHPFTTTQKKLLVGSTRATNENVIFTDNKANLIQTLTKNSGEKRTALRVTGMLDAMKPQQTSPQNSPRPSAAAERAAPKPFLDKTRIIDALNERAEEMGPILMGQAPKKVSASEMRFGSNKGSCILTLTGQHRGKWYDHGTGQGGSLLSLVADDAGLDPKQDFAQVLEHAVKLLGLSRESLLTTKASIKKPVNNKPIENTAEREARQRTAQSIWQQAVPLKSTLAERYLKQHRAIERTDKLKMRFIPKGASWTVYDRGEKPLENKNYFPSLAVAAYDKEGKVSGVQLVRLDSKTAGKNTYTEVAKISRGAIKGAAGLVQKGAKGGRVYIAEGPETAASFASLYPSATVLTSLGVHNLTKMTDVIKKYEPKQVIIAADNDGKDSDARTQTEKAIQTLRQANLPTIAIYPIALPHQKKTDWNDVLQAKGGYQMNQQVKNSVKHANWQLENQTKESAMANTVNQPPKPPAMSAQELASLQQGDAMMAAREQDHQRQLQEQRAYEQQPQPTPQPMPQPPMEERTL